MRRAKPQLESPDNLAETMSRAQAIARSESLQQSSAFLNAIIENIPAIVAVKDARELRFVLLNRAGQELTGVPASESLGKNDFDIFPTDQAEFFVSLDREVLASGEMKLIPEEQITTRHRGVRTLRTTKMPIMDDHGQPQYLLAMSEDITERKQAEAALRASEALFGGLLSASPDPVMAIDETGTILFANESFRPIYGYGPEELIGKSSAMLAPADQHEEIGRRLAGTLDGRTASTVEDIDGLRRDGTRFPTEVTISEQRTDTGRIFIVSIRDATERKAMESQLRQAQKMEAIGNLTGGVAHDFNNLLSVVIGNLDLLREQLGDRPKADDLANEALEAALRGAELTKRLLAFARRQPLQPRRADVNELVNGISKLLARTMGDNFRIRHRLGRNVLPVMVDVAQFENSLVNLVANARDAMPDGGTLTISTGNRDLDEDYASMHPGLVPGEYAMIEVTDEGGGIPKEILDRIFEPFFTTKSEGRGTGLGLSMVFGFMKQSDGHISVYSELGHGTTFRLFFPAAAGGEAQATAHEATPAQGGHETILTVEDNPALRSLVVKQLTELGYRCLEAADGPSALKMLERERIDVLFSDVMMPGGQSGYDLGREAKRRWPAIKVLLTSGFPSDKLGDKGQVPADVPLLTKPYRKGDLAVVLRQLVDAG